MGLVPVCPVFQHILEVCRVCSYSEVSWFVCSEMVLRTGIFMNPVAAMMHSTISINRAPVVSRNLLNPDFLCSFSFSGFEFSQDFFYYFFV